MKKLCLSILASLALTLGLVSQVQADEYLRIGMEAAYAPFNWTQDNDSNGAVKIDGTNQYANGYDVQIAKKIAKNLGKEPLVVKTKWEGLVAAGCPWDHKKAIQRLQGYKHWSCDKNQHFLFFYDLWSKYTLWFYRKSGWVYRMGVNSRCRSSTVER